MDIAVALGLKVRTLQRRLCARGTTYSQIVGQVRVDEAKRLLAERELTLAEISTALAYSDPAHFSRAFGHGTGSTPRAYGARGDRTAAGQGDPPD